jgi:hypothetical protein
MSFPMLLQQTHHLPQLKSGILIIHASQLPTNLYWTEALCSNINSVTILHLVCTSTSAILQCYCVEYTGLPGAPMIKIKLDSVTIWWVIQETLPGTTRNIKYRRHYFGTNLHGTYYTTQHLTNTCPQLDCCCQCFITYAACTCQKLCDFSPPALQLTSLHIRVTSASHSV